MNRARLADAALSTLIGALVLGPAPPGPWVRAARRHGARAAPAVEGRLARPRRLGAAVRPGRRGAVRPHHRRARGPAAEGPAARCACSVPVSVPVAWSREPVGGRPGRGDRAVDLEPVGLRTAQHRPVGLGRRVRRAAVRRARGRSGSATRTAAGTPRRHARVGVHRALVARRGAARRAHGVLRRGSWPARPTPPCRCSGSPRSSTCRGCLPSMVNGDRIDCARRAVRGLRGARRVRGRAAGEPVGSLGGIWKSSVVPGERTVAVLVLASCADHGRGAGRPLAIRTGPGPRGESDQGRSRGAGGHRGGHRRAPRCSRDSPRPSTPLPGGSPRCPHCATAIASSVPPSSCSCPASPPLPTRCGGGAPGPGGRCAASRSCVVLLPVAVPSLHGVGARR